MTETSAPTPAPDQAGSTPPGPGRPSTTPFARSSADRVLGGIASAVAARLAIDPVVVRVVLVILAIAGGGLVVPLYLVTWVVVARDDDPRPRLYPHVAVRDGGALMYVVGALLTIAVLDGITDPFTGPGDGFPLLPLALIGIGVALWTRSDRGSASPSRWPRSDAPPPPGGAAGPATGASGRGATGGDATGGAVGADPSTASTTALDDGGTTPPWPPRAAPVSGPPTPPSGPRRPRERSVLGALTIATALIAAGVAAALDASSSVAIDLGATGVTAVALLVLGLGLLVGSVWGRARWLTLVALLLIPVVGVGVVVREADRVLGIDVGASSGVGERVVTLTGDDPLPSSLSLLAGSIRVDLSAWDPDGADRTALGGDGPDLAIEVGAGEVDLELPADVAWRVVSDVGLGEYRVRDDAGAWITEDVERLVFFPEDEQRDGDRERFVLAGGPDDEPVLDIAVDVALGQVSLQEPIADPTESTGQGDETRPAPPAVVGPTGEPTAGATPSPELPSDDATDAPAPGPSDEASSGGGAAPADTSDSTGGDAATTTTTLELS